MNNQTIYWVWIQQALGYANNKIMSVVQDYTFAEDFYRASLSDKLACADFNSKERSRLADTSLEQAKSIVQSCVKNKIDIVTIGDADYPFLLKEIFAPPVLLYVKGDTSVLKSQLSVAMVGTRSATPYGKRSAFDFAYKLAANNVTVVSGGALGVDTYAHKGALQANGRTICVLGCGLNYHYLMENESMRNSIAVLGAVVSEYPPNFPPSKFTFPQRNRIISGLARGTLVVEAGTKSGSLITANLALEQNRDVFAIPGSILSDVSFGTNKLIKLGAKPVTEVEDILEDYRTEYLTVQHRGYEETLTLFNYEDEEKKVSISENKEKKNKGKSKIEKIASHGSENNNGNSAEKVTAENNADTQSVGVPCISAEDFAELSENAQRVLGVFEEEKLHVDTLSELSGLPINALQSALTELEMCDCIESLQGRIYRILLRIPK